MTGRTSSSRQLAMKDLSRVASTLETAVWYSVSTGSVSARCTPVTRQPRTLSCLYACSHMLVYCGCFVNGLSMAHSRVMQASKSLRSWRARRSITWHLLTVLVVSQLTTYSCSPLNSVLLRNLRSSLATSLTRFMSSLYVLLSPLSNRRCSLSSCHITTHWNH